MEATEAFQTGILNGFTKDHQRQRSADSLSEGDGGKTWDSWRKMEFNRPNPLDEWCIAEVPSGWAQARQR